MTAPLALRRETVPVRVASDPDTERWIRMRSRGFLEALPDAAAASSWRVAGGLEYASHADDYIRDDGPGCMAVSASHRMVTVDLAPGPWRALYSLRAVRHVLRWGLLADMSALFFHGAAIADGSTGHGFCILGPSRAGKSVLSYELMGRGFDWVSQDDLCLLSHDGSSWSVLGWPGSLRLRRDAFDLFPELRKIEPGLAHPANAVEATNASLKDRLHLFPEELAEHRGCGVRGEANVTAFFILDPGLDDYARQPMGAQELRNVLCTAWDVLPERRPGARVMDALKGATRWTDLVFNPGLLEAFGMPDLDALHARIDALAKAIPAWRIGRRALIEGRSDLRSFGDWS